MSTSAIYLMLINLIVNLFYLTVLILQGRLTSMLISATQSHCPLLNLNTITADGAVDMTNTYLSGGPVTSVQYQQPLYTCKHEELAEDFGEKQLRSYKSGVYVHLRLPGSPYPKWEILPCFLVISPKLCMLCKLCSFAVCCPVIKNFCWFPHFSAHLEHMSLWRNTAESPKKNKTSGSIIKQSLHWPNSQLPNTVRAMLDQQSNHCAAFNPVFSQSGENQNSLQTRRLRQRVGDRSTPTITEWKGVAGSVYDQIQSRDKSLGDERANQDFRETWRRAAAWAKEEDITFWGRSIQQPIKVLYF